MYEAGNNLSDIPLQCLGICIHQSRLDRTYRGVLTNLFYPPVYSSVQMEYQVTYLSGAICFLQLHFFNRSRVSSGSIVSDYGLDDRAIGVRSPAGAKDFSSSFLVQTGSGAHPASCTMGTGGVLSPGVKARPGRDADHSPPSSAEVENE
jgi:hypothetical protein